MPSIRSFAILDHDATAVWELVRDVGAVADWFPAMEYSERTAAGRTVRLAGGAVMLEEIVTLDDELRRFQYRILEGDLPVTAHLGTVDVIDLGDHRSVLVYGTDIEPAEVAPAFDGAISQAVAGLNDYLRRAATME